MGNLVRMPHSELHATVEVLDALGVEPTDFERVRQDRNHAARVAEAFKVGRVKKSYPADGEVFELTLDGDTLESDPIEMVRRCGYKDSEQWRYTGKRVFGKQTRSFKLVSIGNCGSQSEVEQNLAMHGRIPEGQWLNAFKAGFPTPDGKGSVGVPDSSWVDSGGKTRFPCILKVGTLLFRWSDGVFHGGWRWLVEVVE